jgi:hypothetical protein
LRIEERGPFRFFDSTNLGSTAAACASSERKKESMSGGIDVKQIENSFLVPGTTPIAKLFSLS